MSEPASGTRGAPGRARVPRQLRERQMIEAAERIFTRRGYGAASMDEIAAECGVTKPMLYAYFGSKEGLFAACGRPHGERLRARLREAVEEAPDDPAQRLWHGLLAAFRLIDEDRETWTVFNPVDRPAPGGPLAARSAMNRAAMAEMLTELMTDVARAGGIGGDALEQIPPLAHALMGAVFGIAGWWLKHPEESAELQAMRVMNLVWMGLENLYAGTLWLPGARR